MLCDPLDFILFFPVCSIGSLLGCKAEILQLDVTDVKMDYFNWAADKCSLSFLPSRLPNMDLNASLPCEYIFN